MHLTVHEISPMNLCTRFFSMHVTSKSRGNTGAKNTKYIKYNCFSSMKFNPLCYIMVDKTKLKPVLTFRYGI